ncbi:MAG: hypothetical protein MHPSP_001869 [Paramarteilia canceri]
MMISPETAKPYKNLYNSTLPESPANSSFRIVSNNKSRYSQSQTINLNEINDALLNKQYKVLKRNYNADSFYSKSHHTFWTPNKSELNSILKDLSFGKTKQKKSAENNQHCNKKVVIKLERKLSAISLDSSLSVTHQHSE